MSARAIPVRMAGHVLMQRTDILANVFLDTLIKIAKQVCPKNTVPISVYIT